MSKSSSQRSHFKKRMSERFGLILNRSQIRQIELLIRDGKSTPIEKQSNRVSVHSVQYEGKEIYVVYDRQRKRAVTALLPKWYLRETENSTE